MDRIIEAIELLKKEYDAEVSSRNIPTSEQFEDAEKKLGVKFSEEFKIFFSNLSYLSCGADEFCMLNEVIECTDSMRENNFYDYFPPNLYVVMDFQCETQCVLQDEDGAIYFSDMHTPPVKVFDSLADYIYLDFIPSIMYGEFYEAYESFYESRDCSNKPEVLNTELKDDRKWFDDQYGLEYYFLIKSEGFKTFISQKEDEFDNSVERFFDKLLRRKKNTYTFRDVVKKYIKKHSIKKLKGEIPKSDNEKYNKIQRVEEFQYYADSI